MREKRRNMEEKNISCASHEAASQQKHGLTRRSFLKWTGAAATVPALGQLVACAPQAKMADTGSDDAPAPALEDEGEWKPYRCFACISRLAASILTSLRASLALTAMRLSYGLGCIRTLC